jgi:hypothetical protein
MDKPAVRRRSPIVMPLLGVVAGAVCGWFAHRAIVVPASESSTSAARPANAIKGPLVEPTNAEFRSAASASEIEIPLCVKNTASHAETSTALDESAHPSAPLSQTPTLDDLRDSVSILCTYGPGKRGHWPRGKLTVVDAGLIVCASLLRQFHLAQERLAAGIARQILE